MRTLEAGNQASANLAETYFRLAAVTPQAKIWSEMGFRACTGQFEHPICNFAADLRLDPWSARRLVELAAGRPTFNVYLQPSDQPGHAGELLHGAGFVPNHRLIHMAADPCSEDEDRLAIEQALTFAQRHDVATFMVEQFFGRQPSGFKRRVAETTCAAIEMPLLYLRERGRLAAAAMLSEAGGALGVYNLCVAAPMRGRGLGAAFVRTLRAEADRPLVLQCEPALEMWYTNLGFRGVGTVEILSLPKRYPVDIMDRA